MSANTGDTHNIQGTTSELGEGQDSAEAADTASGGPPEQPDTTDPRGLPVDNPSGG